MDLYFNTGALLVGREHQGPKVFANVDDDGAAGSRGWRGLNVYESVVAVVGVRVVVDVVPVRLNERDVLVTVDVIVDVTGDSASGNVRIEADVPGGGGR